MSRRVAYEETLDLAVTRLENLAFELRETPDAPPKTVMYTDDIIDMVERQAEYEKAGDGCDSVHSILIESGISDWHPLVVEFAELKTELYWVSEQLAHETR